MKNCTKCKINKDSNQFSPNKRCKDGLASWCKLCAQEAVDRYKEKNVDKIKSRWKVDYETNKDKFLNRRLRTNYGLTLDEYRTMSEKQNNKCAVCNKVETSIDIRSGKIKLLSVDHCHKTNKIRGLLCNNCNKAEGLLKGNPAIIRKLADYIEIHSVGVTPTE